MHLTKYELQIMKLMWEQERPLTRYDIIHNDKHEKCWKTSSIHVFLNSLLEKKAIQVAGFTKVGKRYGRMYQAAIDRSQYCTELALEVCSNPMEMLLLLIEKIDPNDIEVLQYALKTLQVEHQDCLISTKTQK